jgi:PAS domain S-box-containing protein
MPLTLQRQIDSLEDILAALTDGFVIVDPQGGLTRWNPAASEMLGALLPGEQVLRRLVFDPSTRLDPADPAGLVRRLADDGRVQDDRVHLDGAAPRTLSVLLFPITHDDVVTGIGVTLRDITTAVRDADTLQRLALAVDASADAIYVTNGDSQIEYVNTAFTTVTGWSREVIRGHNPRVLKSGRTDPGIYQDMWETLRRGEVWSGRVINRRRATAADGTVAFEDYWAQSTIAPYF